MAENDRDVYRRSQAALAREKEIMKDVEGWEVSGRLFNLCLSTRLACIVSCVISPVWHWLIDLSLFAVHPHFTGW